MFKNNHPFYFLCLFLWLLFGTGCNHSVNNLEATKASSNGSELLVVDCLLPGQVRQLGQSMTYLTQRRPIKTSAQDCEIRGGEYVAYDRADYRTALKIWLPQAKQNNPEAQVYVGEIYEKGVGLAPDYRTAAYWYAKAAAQGNARAQINLGYLYEKGLGVKKDMVTALNWYRKSSGLDSDDLAFASTIETAVKAEYEDELKLLRNALNSNQVEIAALQSALDKSTRQYQQEQQNLQRLQAKLQRSKASLKQLKNTQSAPDIQNKTLAYSKQIEQQHLVVAKLQQQLNQENTALAQKLKQAEQRSLQLSEELIKHKQDKGLLESKLILAQTQLSRAKLAISKLSTQQQAQQQKILAEKQQLQAAKAEQGGNTKRIQQLEAQLATAEQILKQQQAQIKAKQQDKISYQKQIKQLQKAEQQQQVAYLKPSIEILDPPVTVTRSNMPSVRLRSIMSHRDITGRVTAPAGLLAFNINGLKQEISDTGIFKASIKLKGEKTLVRSVAVDKSGHKVILEFMLLANQQATADKSKYSDNVAANIKGNINFGKYYALVIGNQNYQYLSDLNTPINDAQEVDKILREKYGFHTTLLLNANRYEILSALNELRENLSATDNLLIYYAGHGELDRVNLRGHWLPVDAEQNNTANWLSTLAITDIVNAIPAKHVLIVADSCYSGSMTRSSLARPEVGMNNALRAKWLRLMTKTRSRTVLSSGGLKPVLDDGANGHSLFANAFISVLNNNHDILEGQSLYRQVYEGIAQASKKIKFKQEPQYAPIRHGGHEAGDFFLVSATQ